MQPISLFQVQNVIASVTNIYFSSPWIANVKSSHKVDNYLPEKGKQLPESVFCIHQEFLNESRDFLSVLRRESIQFHVQFQKQRSRRVTCTGTSLLQQNSETTHCFASDTTHSFASHPINLFLNANWFSDLFHLSSSFPKLDSIASLHKQSLLLLKYSLH